MRKRSLEKEQRRQIGVDRPGLSSFHNNSANSPNQTSNLYSFNSAKSAMTRPHAGERCQKSGGLCQPVSCDLPLEYRRQIYRAVAE